MQGASRSVLTKAWVASKVHYSFYGRSATRNFSSTVARGKERVVILGSGWGGYGLLRGIDKERYGMGLIHAL